MRENLDGMAGTSARTLQLLSLLQDHRHWSGVDLADRLGVSERTVRRDVDRLRDLGYPVESQRGAEGGYQLVAGASLPPLVLDDDEAVALVIGLQTAARGGVAGVADASVRALAKVIAVLPTRLRSRGVALQSMTTPLRWDGMNDGVDAEVLTTLAEAGRAMERVEFGYVAARGERSDRRVEPHRLVLVGQRWYLVAYDMVRGDWRTFRVDRIDAVRATGARFADRPIPGGDAAELVRRAISRAPTGPRIEVLVHAPADAVRDHSRHWAEVEPVDATTCRMTMQTDQFEWPLMLLGAIGAEFEVLEPPAFATAAQEWAGRFARAAARS